MPNEMPNCGDAAARDPQRYFHTPHIVAEQTDQLGKKQATHRQMRRVLYVGLMQAYLSM